MNLRQIQELIKFVAKSGATEVDIEIGDVKLSIKSPPKGKVANNNEPVYLPPQIAPTPQPAIIQQSPLQPSTSPISQVAQQQENIDPPAIDKEEKSDNYITIKAPIIGTFYRRSSPEKDPFVNVGDKVEQGQVLCIIEAMKLFNEIESELTGTIVKVLVEDMSPVEYDQPLFLIDPA